MSTPRQPPRRRRSRPAHPETPRTRLAEIGAEIQEVPQQIEHSRQACRLIHKAAELTVLEQEITRLTDRLAQLLIAETLPRAADDPPTNQQARSLVQGAGVKLQNQGQREVTIRTTRGSLAIRVTSYSRNCDRSRQHQGLDPAWLVWGVHDGWTPGLASEVSQLVAMLGSLAEVEHLLEGRGHDMSINTIRGIAYRFAARARAVPRAGRLDWGESVLGRRVVISTDGGWLRIRTTKRGPKTAKGRNRYRTDWSEPKLLMIYIRDEPGKREREFLAVIDGTRRGPEAILALMACYVRALKIETADQILLIADGARGIGNRVESLVRGLGIKPGQMHSLVDF